MTPLFKASIALIVLASLGACKTEKEEVHTVQYFADNPAERATQLEACETRDFADDDANCRNAMEADAQAQRKRERDAIEKMFGSSDSN